MYKKPRGTSDLIGKKASDNTMLRFVFNQILTTYNYDEIICPTFESTEVFSESVGLDSDIVSKEMFTFLDKKGRNMTLRPEYTASIMRAVVENKMYVQNSITKLHYFGPCFRYERPQKGRQREFYQCGAEIIGMEGISAEIEILNIIISFLNSFEINDGYILRINYLVSGKNKEKYKIYLLKFLNNLKLCDDCQIRIKQNPLRILDCKIDYKKFDDAPKMLDYIDDISKKKFNQFIEWLDLTKINYKIDHKLVRGLDYYNGIIFEFDSNLNKDEIITFAGGGRYDGLLKKFGVNDVACVGFGLGIERLLLILENRNIQISSKQNVKIYLSPICEKAMNMSILTSELLRRNGFIVEGNYLPKNIKQSFKNAELLNSEYIAIINEDSVKTQKFKIKNLKSKIEEFVDIKNLIDYLNK